MKQHSEERKEAVLRKLAPPMNLTVPVVAEAEGNVTASLYNWRTKARERGEVLPSRGSAPEQWSSKDKFRVVLETAPMNEAELSACCRECGLYPEQVEAWRSSCMNGPMYFDDAYVLRRGLTVIYKVASDKAIAKEM